MCRFAAYLGPPAPLSTLVYDAPRSLQVQSYDPREQQHGRVNVDGTGLAWWWEGTFEPLRYRVDRPPWQDHNLPSLSRHLRAGAQLAMVRSATPGIGIGPTFVHPFVHGRLAGTHNGWIGSFKTSTARPLLSRLPGELFATLDGMSDAQTLFLTAVHHYERDPGAGLAVAVARACADVAEVCISHNTGGMLNLLVGDGTTFAAARVGVDATPNSLYVLQNSPRWPDAFLLASEPLDEDGAWKPVEAGHVAALTPDGVDVRPIPEL